MRFFLGTHETSKKWWNAEVPLFVSRRRLMRRTVRKFPQARVPWALDSGGFTELNLFGRWRTSESEYVANVKRFEQEIGQLAWVAPMDWMCEPSILAKTGLTVREHQQRTVDNYRRLRWELPGLVIPVLQGWDRDDYLRCWEMYEYAGIDLASEALVGLGTVCRRQNTTEAAKIVRELEALKLHGFGIKLTGLFVFGDSLASADSMAWSYNARKNPPLPGCRHDHCSNCLLYALRWREQILRQLGQIRLEEMLV